MVVIQGQESQIFLNTICSRAVAELLLWGDSVFFALKLRLAPGERDVAVPYHMLDLSLHSNAEQRKEVHDEYRPEHGNIEQFEEGTHERNHRGFGGRIPELELWQPTDEGSELFVLSGGQLGSILVVEFAHGRIYLGSEKREEQIQVIDC